MSCLGCFDQHTNPAAAIVCYDLAFPERAGRLSTAPSDAETGADLNESGAGSAEKGAVLGLALQGGTGMASRPGNAVEGPSGLRVACREHRPRWRLACSSCNA